MNRYVDAEHIKICVVDALVDNDVPPWIIDCVVDVIDSERLADNVPADVAPVVRCKDCKYGEIDDPDFPNQYFCHYYGDDWNEGEHFCSNGERKE